MAREKILVVDYDLDSLSRIYLALIHRKFKVEACNHSQEIKERLKRSKPAAIILGANDYKTISEKLKIPAIVFMDKDSTNGIRLNDGDIQLERPVPANKLIEAIEKLI